MQRQEVEIGGEENDVKAKLTELYRRSHDHAVEALEPRDTDAARDGDTWTGADVMVHITSWNRWLIEVIAAAKGLGSSPIVSDEDAKNARTFREGRLLSIDQVFADAERVEQELLAALDTLTEEDLSKELITGSQPQPRLVWRIIFGTQTHTIEHVKQLLMDEGEPDAAVSLYRAALADTGELFGPGSVPFAYTSYNVACVCARTGKLAEAITALRDAVVIDSQLARLSLDDSDLDALRGLPKFKELYTTRG